VGLVCLFAVRDVCRYGAGVWQTLQRSCLRQAAAFGASAAEWIVREDLRSLATASKLLLMGSGLYVDVVVRGEAVVGGTDEGIDVAPVDPASEPPMGTMLTRRCGAVEVLTPIALAGYPDLPIGFLRVGFADDYAADRVRQRAWIVGAVATACSLVCVGGIALGLRRIRSGDRAVDGDERVLRCGPLEIDRQCCAVRFDGRPVDLTPKLFELLSVFAQSPGTVFSDDDLLRAVWSDSAYAASSDVKQHIYLLRRKFSEIHPCPKALIENVKGFGYRLVPTANEKELSSH